MPVDGSDELIAPLSADNRGFAGLSDFHFTIPIMRLTEIIGQLWDLHTTDNANCLMVLMSRSHPLSADNRKPAGSQISISRYR